ncbi:hypothetical protein C8Q76DRAFT_788939 [Earliella scabrosa]|nr:hypothetical protein C8Q76DRAFT_788939 [Earliella scabrosa]
MGRQDETFYTEEKEWLRVQVRQQVVRDVLVGGVKDKLSVAANIIWPAYQEVFPRPFPAETEKAFLTRRRYAHGDRRNQLSKRPAETVEGVEKRMRERFSQIREWIRRNWRIENGLGSKGPTLGIPPLKAKTRPKRVSAFDMFRNSALRDELVPQPLYKSGRPNIGLGNRLLAQAFGRLGIAKKVQFQAEADELNAQEAQEERAQYATEEDYLRAVKVPSVQEWVQYILEHIQSEVGWIGGLVIGGPDEHGQLRVRSATTAVDSHGRNFVAALCERIQWSPEEFNVWCAAWMYNAHRTAQTPGVKFGDMNYEPDAVRAELSTTDLEADYEPMKDYDAGEQSAPPSGFACDAQVPRPETAGGQPHLDEFDLVAPGITSGSTYPPGDHLLHDGGDIEPSLGSLTWPSQVEVPFAALGDSDPSIHAPSTATTGYSWPVPLSASTDEQDASTPTDQHVDITGATAYEYIQTHQHSGHANRSGVAPLDSCYAAAAPRDAYRSDPPSPPLASGSAEAYQRWTPVHLINPALADQRHIEWTTTEAQAVMYHQLAEELDMVNEAIERGHPCSYSEGLSGSDGPQMAWQGVGDLTSMSAEQERAAGSHAEHEAWFCSDGDQIHAEENLGLPSAIAPSLYAYPSNGPIAPDTSSPGDRTYAYTYVTTAMSGSPGADHVDPFDASHSPVAGRAAQIDDANHPMLTAWAGNHASWLYADSKDQSDVDPRGREWLTAAHVDTPADLTSGSHLSEQAALPARRRDDVPAESVFPTTTRHVDGAAGSRALPAQSDHDLLSGTWARVRTIAQRREDDDAVSLPANEAAGASTDAGAGANKRSTQPSRWQQEATPVIFMVATCSGPGLQVIATVSITALRRMCI